MRKEKLLIFDLDDTIFETRSIPKAHLQGVFDEFEQTFHTHFAPGKFDEVEKDLWRLPFDLVARKHHFPPLLTKQYSSLINEREFKFKIQPFPDYKWLRKNRFRKILLTTGFRQLQLAKVTALGIENDFEAIYIDEVDALDRIFKLGIMSEIITKSGLSKKDHLVIGDNPESELKAGFELGLTTIQVAKFDQERSPYSDQYITHFQELSDQLALDY